MKDELSGLKLCSATTAEGKPCTKAATYGNECYFHSQSEALKLKRHQTAILGGTHLARLPKIKGLEIKDSRDLHRYISKVLTHMSSGRIKLTTGHLKDIANLSKVFLETESKSNILARIERIEKEKQL